MRKVSLCKDCRYFTQLKVTLWGKPLYNCMCDLPNEFMILLAKKSRDLTFEQMDVPFFCSRLKEAYEIQKVPDYCPLKMEYMVMKQDEKFRNM